jgi:hypothetical protein
MQYNGWSTWWSLVASSASVIVFRGIADLALSQLIPVAQPHRCRQPCSCATEDVIGRRRRLVLAKKARFALVFGSEITIVLADPRRTWLGTIGDL